jgi:HD-GYP domain-containing protein (c-di-GMP phosphodiesterase class II)/DNA-binding CsgD family transcriptional regulator
VDVGVSSGRLAELTIALSLATDLGFGQPIEQGLRTCWLSLAASEQLGLDAPARSAVYYVALLRFVGCTSDASETAVLAGGDDIAFLRAMTPMAMADVGEGMRFFVAHLAEDLPLHRRVGRVVRALTDPGWERRSLAGHCEVASRLAVRLGLGEAVRLALAHAYERWDGKGLPDGLAGEEVPVAMRVVTVARDVELWAHQAGWPAALDVLGHRRGHAYDPAVVDAFVAEGERWLAAVGDDPCARVLDAEPGPVLWIGAAELDGALSAVADFTDLKSVWLRGHSTGVAKLVTAAARTAGMPGSDAATVGRAALVHDVGRVGVASGIWDHPGRLSAEQLERVRLHPYLGERVLRRCGFLSPYADLAACHHERADGSGYHRGAKADQLDLGARLLAAADAFHAMTEPRPTGRHSPPVTRRSSLSPRSTPAGFDGSRSTPCWRRRAKRPGGPAGPAKLTEREVEVLRLIARGHANKQVAAVLGISPKTVGHHIEHVYAKAGVSARAGATLWAMEHGLLSP